MSATFCPCDHDFSQYTLPFASAIVAYQRELERVQYTEAIICRCFTKWMFLKFWQNSQDNTCAVIPFLIKLQAPSKKKETPTQLFFCKHTFYRRALCNCLGRFIMLGYINVENKINVTFYS